jgi:hypothetical protein
LGNDDISEHLNSQSGNIPVIVIGAIGHTSGGSFNSGSGNIKANKVKEIGHVGK